MKTLLIIAMLFASSGLVAGVESLTPSFIAAASAQNEEVVEVEEEGEVDEEGEVEETYEEEEQPEEPEQDSEPASDAGA